MTRKIKHQDITAYYNAMRVKLKGDALDMLKTQTLIALISIQDPKLN